MLAIDVGAVQRVGEPGGAPASPLGVADEGSDGVGVDLDRDARESLRVQVLEIGVEVPRVQIRHTPRTRIKPVEELSKMPATVPYGAWREPALLGHPSREVVEQSCIRSRPRRQVR